MLSYHSWHIYRTWKSSRLGGILKLSYGGKATKGWDHLYGESYLLKTPCKEFNVAIGKVLGWMKWLKNGAEKVYISWNYSCIRSFLVKTLLVKLSTFKFSML